eukprot:TRINITY_DN3660_c0_g2_i1.p1 TRINITY_DN3660_c0_g2~~TRINITY_DN3660_c0_g2_i1.p1  ORF type:complete len:658 (+),score=136.18 TRINITY_DN3660_c0_g2_i1:75-2048(+)
MESMKLVWLSGGARDLLRSLSKILKGDLPCPASRLADLLKDASVATECEGLLANESVREEFSKKLRTGVAPKEINDTTVAAVVELFAAVLHEKLSSIQSRAGVAAKSFPAKWDVMNYEELTASVFKGKVVGEVFKRDWMVWHSVGHGYDSKAVPQLSASVLKERLCVAASCDDDGALSDLALINHVLEHVEAYVAWEASIPGSMSKTAAKPLGVLVAFDESTSREVALRRVLAGVLPAEVATSVASEATSAADVKGVLMRLAEESRARAVIPLFTAPPAAAEAKSKGDKAATVGGKSGVMKPGEFKKCHETTASQELQWHLLRYRLFRTTSLSATQPKVLGAEVQAAVAAKPAVQRGAKVRQDVAGVSSNPRPAGFAGTWAPTTKVNCLPPGHTPYSWEHTKAEGMKEGFPCTWTPVGAGLPPGHTPYSWEKVLSGATTSDAAISAKGGAPSCTQENAKPAAAKGGPAAPKSQPVPAGAQPAEGSPEAALTKVDIRCGLIMKCEKVPGSEKLFLLDVNIGDEKPRQVITGLQKHYAVEELKDRKVVVYCNIKPGKLAGYESQAMVLAATKDKGSESEVCKLLDPPAGSSEGARIMCGGFEVGCNSATQSVKHISKFWNQVTPVFLANDRGEAAFNGVPLTMDGKTVTTGGMTCVPIS